MTQTANKQTRTAWPSIGALWSLLWRSVVFAPFAMVCGGIWLTAWPLLIILPICEMLNLIDHDWLWASIVPFLWILLFFFTRSHWFKANRKDFPNQQENV
jgi:hypothetical protein